MNLSEIRTFNKNFKCIELPKEKPQKTKVVKKRGK